MQTTKKIISNVLFVSIFSFSFGTSLLVADEVSAIREMTKEKVDLVISTLKDNNLTKEEKKEGILQTIDGLLILV